MKFTSIGQNVIHPFKFAGEIDRKEYCARNFELFNVLSATETAARPPIQIAPVVINEDIEAAKIKAQYTSREAKIKHIKDLTGRLEPDGPIEIKPKKEYKKGETIDIKV